MHNYTNVALERIVLFPMMLEITRYHLFDNLIIIKVAQLLGSNFFYNSVIDDFIYYSEHRPHKALSGLVPSNFAKFINKSGDFYNLS
ncbi:MAG: hypothetical protein PV340_04740 [Wolbachia sp.]|nr:hypothetical protein [Wolbachia sp.]MDD9336052.1 hypothetical protein [Wolbachia sp.]